MSKHCRVSAALALAAVTGCSSGSSLSTDTGTNLTPVTSGTTAHLVVTDMQDAVEGGVVPKLSPGSATVVLNGDKSGTATVKGDFSEVPCGGGVGTITEINIDITFSHFGTMGRSTNTETILDGLVNYQSISGACATYYETWAAILTKPFYSGAESPLHFQMIVDGGSWGYADALTFYSENGSGWAVPSNGVRYQF